MPATATETFSQEQQQQEQQQQQQQQQTNLLVLKSMLQFANIFIDFACVCRAPFLFYSVIKKGRGVPVFRINIIVKEQPALLLLLLLLLLLHLLQHMLLQRETP